MFRLSDSWCVDSLLAKVAWKVARAPCCATHRCPKLFFLLPKGFACEKGFTEKTRFQKDF